MNTQRPTRNFLLLAIILLLYLSSFTTVFAYNYVSAITGTWKKSRDYNCWKKTTTYFNDQARCFYSNGTVKYLKNNKLSQNLSWSMKGNVMTIRGQGWYITGNISFPQQGQMLLHSYTYSNNRKTAETKSLYIKGNIDKFYDFNYFSGNWFQYKRYNCKNGKIDYPNTNWYFDTLGNMSIGKIGARYYLAGNLVTLVYNDKKYNAAFCTFQFDNVGNLTITSPNFVNYLKRGGQQSQAVNNNNNYQQPRNNYNNNYNNNGYQQPRSNNKNNYQQPSNNRYQLYKNGRNVLTDPGPQDF